MEKIYGIDLGTTYSCIATVDEYGKAIVLKNSDGSDVTPSVVYYESQDNIVVGEAAKDEYDADRRVAFIKREIGNDNFVSKCIFPEDPVIVSSYILRKLVQDANEELGADIKDVVITCPAYFGTKEKMQTQQAGEIAGLNVLAILQEPTAAAISYGVNTKENKTILVYDLGGGTFDVTLIKVSGSKIHTIATGGDSRLGGVDWDKEIVKYLASQYENETGEVDILDNKETETQLYLLAEKAKKTLTNMNLYKAPVMHDDNRVKVELTREMFDSLTSNHLNRTMSIVADVIEAAKQKVDGDNEPLFDGQIDEVLLVGGSCRMPQVKSMVDETLGCDSKMFDPDQAVAKGAALHALALKTIYDSRESLAEQPKDKGLLSKFFKPKADAPTRNVEDPSVINVLSRSYGISSVMSCNHDIHIVSTMIFQQDELPIETSRTFRTINEGQNRMNIAVYETVATRDDIIHDVKHGKPIEKFAVPIDEGVLLDKSVIRFGKPMPIETPVKVTFHLDAQGILTVSASEALTGNAISFQIHLNGVRTKEEVKTAAVRVSRVKIQS
ncbi:MAG: Hsp70 family protein [Rikenellaceae bacterium]